uniref:Methyltransferase domain-containing protein n=1 Tax=Ditylum brightwellii TaxID=49249 RepID=A0A6U3RC29_9STRA|mmetsp:Transcript_26364/g.39177  ORF Transcript_26364/g.39177 Transcript_26364/m.39177 type:complete len:350 (+) Transcript_26364:251-1300(+)
MPGPTLSTLEMRSSGGKNRGRSRSFVVALLIVTVTSVISIAKYMTITSDSIAGFDDMKKEVYNFVSSSYNQNRLCTQNQYANVLKLPLNEYARLMDQWLANKTLHEKKLMENPDSLAHSHTRFQAFEVMGDCTFDCIGGECHSDISKVVCGGTAIKAPCVVYSIGGNNQWEFELDLLKKTPCEIHTFDCTGERERFQKPDNDRLHFHHVCLGTANAPAPKTPPIGKNDIGGEFWTLEKMQKTLNHTQIDLLKIDIEGYEIPLLNSWPILTDIKSSSAVLPMQVLVEVHYRTQMKELAAIKQADWKFPTDMINLQEHFLKMGYAVVIRDDNKYCNHCTELTLVRIKCPSL